MVHTIPTCKCKGEVSNELLCQRLRKFDYGVNTVKINIKLFDMESKLSKKQELFTDLLNLLHLWQEKARENGLLLIATL